MSVNSSVTVLQLSSLSSANQASVHLLPCDIDHDGPAQVDQFFTPIVKEHKKDKTASFRGRGLKGQEVQLPQGYKGMVLKEVQKPSSDQDDRVVKASSVFDKFTYWNLETPPTSDDKIIMAMGWPKLAEVIHAPVED